MFGRAARHLVVFVLGIATVLMDGAHASPLSTEVTGWLAGSPLLVHQTISAGGGHSCHVTGRREVMCYGYNRFGSLGDGMSSYQRENDARAALRAMGVSNVIEVTSGRYHSCALVANGQVYCWGANDGGQVGDGTLTNRPLPVPVFGLSDAISVSAGADHTCALRADRSLSCWGRNSDGELGVGDRVRYSFPVTVSGLTNVARVSAGGWSADASTCALTIGGIAYCWGANTYGQLGTPPAPWQLSPVAVPGIPLLASISVGGQHACGLGVSGQVVCWGSNNQDQLGQGLTFTATAIAAAGRHTCALLVDRTVRCWGGGNLGNGSTAGSAVPVVVTGLDEVVELAADTSGLYSLSENQTCARRVSGEVFCWGNNREGKIGDGFLGIAIPATINDAPANYAEVVGGGNHSCARLTGGGVRCWGTNTNGELGNGTNVPSAEPRPVVGIADAIGLAAGRFHTCALRSTGGVSCWGANNRGQLGNGSTSASQLPQAVTGVSGAVAVIAGGQYSCALLSSGAALCWGANDYGQLGSGSNTYQDPLPVPVASTAAITRFSAGLAHACARLATGGVICWGGNQYGQVGHDSPNNIIRTPVAVVGITDAVAVAAGGDSRDIITSIFGHSCAVLASGRVKCWGYNAYGQVGDGTRENRGAPVDVVGLTGAVAVTAGGAQTCATNLVGAVRCWGGNDLGQLGNASTVDIAVPSGFVPAPPLESVSAGRDHTCAVERASRQPTCWGNNRYLAIGIAATEARTLPTRVLGLPDQLDYSDTLFADDFE